MKALQIIESAYRCTIEEQDDPAIWISHVMYKAGAELDVLLRGNAVNYAVKDQDASGLSFGEIVHAHPPSIETEVNRFLENGVLVYLVAEDAVDRGIRSKDLIPGIESVSRGSLPEIMERYEQVWHW